MELTEEQVKHLFRDSLNDELQLKVLKSEDDSHSRYLLLHPWNDDTLSIFVPDNLEEATQLASVLNSVELPKKYSGILHESGQLEIFWTALRLRPKHQEIATRDFSVWWNGRKRRCYFGGASEEALTLNKYVKPHAAPSHTEHRNTMTFHLFSNGMHDDALFLDKPVCFWIDAADLSPEDLDSLIVHLNVYMTYYDRESPRVMLHETEFTESTSRRNRYIIENFPEEISIDKINSAVASFWLGAFETSDPGMKYLLYYRLIEYLSNAHLTGC